MSRALVACLVVSAIAFIVPHAARAGATGSGTPVILDTDIYSGADDVGALASLLALNLRGEDQVIGVVVNTRTSRPSVATDSWKCVAAMTQFYGYPNIPIGSGMPDNGPDPSSYNFIGPCAKDASPHTAQPLPAVEVYRKALAAQPNNSVVVVCTGYEENLKALLESSPDSFSSLDGQALVAQKVNRLVVMGGTYPSTTTAENNFAGDAGSARYVVANWPTTIVYSGSEVGSLVLTGHSVSSAQPANSPVRAALLAVAGAGKNIMSYDITAAYHAIRPSDGSLTEVGPGNNTISTTAGDAFTAGTGSGTTTQTSGGTSGTDTVAVASVAGLIVGMSVADTTNPTFLPSGTTITAIDTPTLTLTLSHNWATSSGLGDTLSYHSSLKWDDYYLSLTSASALDASIEALWDTLPGTTHQTVAFTTTPPGSPTVGGGYAASASPGASGNPVTLSIDPTSTSGCTINDSGDVSFGAPLGTCIVDANEPGTTTYAPATASQTINVAGIPQTISFTTTPPSSPVVGGSYDVAANGGGSGKAVTISIDKSSTSGCTVNGSDVVKFSGPPGTCVVDANQLGNTTYAPAPTAQQTISITGIPQTISFTSTPPTSATVGSAPYTPAATSTSGLPVTLGLDAASTGCTIKKGTVNFKKVGTCLIDATQGGSDTYLAASMQQQSIAIGKGASVITIKSAGPKNARAGGIYTPKVRSSSGDVVRLALGAGSTGCAIAHASVVFRALGICKVVFIDAGNANYGPAPTEEQTFAIGMGHLRLTVNVSPTQPKSGATITLTAHVSVPFATGMVTFTAHSTVLCTAMISGGIARCNAATHLPAGAYAVIATYSGSSSFHAAASRTVVRFT